MNRLWWSWLNPFELINSRLRGAITVIDVDSYDNWVPLYWAVYSVYMDGIVLRIDFTERGYHLMLLGNYPMVQLMFNADMNANAPKRLFVAKRKDGKLRHHRIVFDREDARRIVESL